jgi:hypothetical protein
LHDFFRVGQVGGRYLAEDYAFFARWRKIGGQVWLDPAIKLRHHGAQAIVGDPMQMFEPGGAEVGERAA